jgi:hypothetical protein
MPMSGTLGWALPTIHHWITDIFFNLELDSRDLLCYSRCMNETQLIQGRLISPEDIEQIRALMIENPKWHRTRLSIEICRLWNWIDATGRHKDMACRTLLLKLDRRGLIHLPARVGPSTNHRRSKSFQPLAHDTTPIEGSLALLQPIQLLCADSGPVAAMWQTLLSLYHYLGFTTKVGRSISYLAVDRHGRPVGCLLFGACAWKTAARDRFIGWDSSQRCANMHKIANNMRFLIPPFVRVPHLASHLLSLAIDRLRCDWPQKYGFSLCLLETFVDTSRFAGTCYRAANFKYVGDTTGRSRNDTHHSIQKPIKAIYLYPMHKHFQKHLCSRTCP